MRKKIIILLLGFIFFINPTKAAESKSYIDYPSNSIYSGTMNVSGWIMSTTNIDDIKLYIDNNETQYKYEKVKRPDVVKAITGYGDNETPGFSGEVDISNYPDGVHNLKLDFISNNEVINTSSVNFNITKKTLIYIDYPENNVNSNLNIQGWVMSTDSFYNLKTYIDGNEINIDYTKVKRNDVIKTIKGYGNEITNKTPGFTADFDITNYNSGPHTLKIDVVNKNNEVIASSTKTFNFEKYKSTSYIDYPSSSSYFSNMLVSGWVMSTVRIDEIKAYIDGNETSFNYETLSRPDVIKAITGYGKNENPGFKGIVDIAGYSNGVHNLKLEFRTNGETIAIREKKFNIEKKGKIYIDYPTGKTSGSKVDIQGWIMSTDANYNIKTYIDDKEVGINYTRIKRSDVIKAIKGYGDEITNELPGFKGKLNISEFLNGNHILKIDVLDKNGELITSTSNSFNLDKYQSLMEIDEPTDSKVSGTSVNLKGWFLSHASNASLHVSIDDFDFSNNVKMVTRKDVIKIYGTKYNKTNDDLVGFNFKLPLDKVKDGKRTIKLSVVDNQTGEVIITRTKEINLKKYKTHMDLNEPIEKYTLNGVQLKIRGWSVSNSPSSRVEVLVNDQNITDEISYTEREDVYKVYSKEFNLNKTDKVGFIGTHDMKEVKDGTVTVKINVIDNTTNEIISTFSRNIKLKKYKTIMDLNDPAENTTSIGTALDLRGWFISTSPSKRLEITINDQNVSPETNYYEREDVYRVYGNSYNLDSHELDGFKLSHDVSNFKDGNVKIKLNVIDNTTNEIIGSFERTIKLKKYDGMLTIDYPTRYNFSKTATLTVGGWELSSLDNSIVKVYIDDREYEVNREDREDVFKVYPTLLGGREMNEKPGFISSIFLNDVSEGLHKVKVKLYSKLNELITEKSLNIFVYSNTYFGIDVSSHQGYIDWDQVGKSGIDFAILRVGYGSNFSDQDDVRFKSYVEGCVRNKIPYGVYLYSYATGVNGRTDLNNSTATSDSEAQHTLRILNSLNSVQKSYLKLPVFIDMEEDRYAYLGMNTLTTIADNYCNIIQASGYKCGVYANKNWLNNHLNNNYLASKYDIWLAHYVDVTDYKGIFQIWQYTSSGHLAGINSSGLDMNISFKKYW